MPLVSVIIPAHNAADTISEALDSIFNQTFPDIEVFVVNDASTDRTEDILRRESAGRSNLRYINANFKNVAAARNAGAELTDSKYIAVMDADDVSHPQRIARLISEFQRNSNAVAIGSKIDWFGAKFGSPRMVLTPKDCRTALGIFSPLCHPSSMFVRKIGEKAGNYNSELPFVDDFNFFCRISNFGDIYNINDTLLRYRIHSTQMSQSKKTMQCVQMWQTLNDFHNKTYTREQSDLRTLSGMLSSAVSLGPLHSRQSYRALKMAILGRSKCTK